MTPLDVASTVTAQPNLDVVRSDAALHSRHNPYGTDSWLEPFAVSTSCWETRGDSSILHEVDQPARFSSISSTRNALQVLELICLVRRHQQA